MARRPAVRGHDGVRARDGARTHMAGGRQTPSPGRRAAREFTRRRAPRKGPSGSGKRSVAMRVSSILVDNTEHPAAGILTPGSTRAVRLPDFQLVSGVLLDGTLPGHSGGTVPESHRLPCTAGLALDYIVGRPSKTSPQARVGAFSLRERAVCELPRASRTRADGAAWSGPEGLFAGHRGSVRRGFHSLPRSGRGAAQPASEEFTRVRLNQPQLVTSRHPLPGVPATAYAGKRLYLLRHAARSGWTKIDTVA
jgi:hypothetical protein